MELHYNGIDATTGTYLFPPQRLEEIREERDETVSDNERDRLNLVKSATKKKRDVVAGVDANNLKQAGWGIIFAKNTPREVRAALRPLCDIRRNQAGMRYREWCGDQGLSQLDTGLGFLERNGVGPGPVDPDRMPYHLLLVGCPKEIPFHIQQHLSIQHSVGRLCFDNNQDYTNYAAKVIRHESPKKIRLFRSKTSITLFGPDNPGDPPTSDSSEYLINQLGKQLSKGRRKKQVHICSDQDATRANLLNLLAAEDPKRLTFFAGHGIGVPSGHNWQEDRQGALVCQDWGGPQSGRLFKEHYLSAGDVPTIHSVGGGIIVLFSCFGAGSPQFCNFSGKDALKRVAPEPFISSLANRLLAIPDGARAVAAHVDRAFGQSFMWKRHPQTQIFRSSFERILNGERIGRAMEVFGTRYAELKTQAIELAEIARQFPGAVKRHDLIMLRRAAHDARNYVILGDPAVAL